MPTSAFYRVKTFLDRNTSLLFLFVLLIVICAESMSLASAAIPIFAANGSGTLMATIASITIFGSLGFVQFLTAYRIQASIVSALNDLKITPAEVLFIVVLVVFYYLLWRGAFHINLVLEGVIPLAEMVQKILPESLIGNYSLVSTKSVSDSVTPTYNNFRAMALTVIILYLVPALEIIVAFLAVLEGIALGKSKTSTATPAPIPSPIPSPSPSSSPVPTPTTPPVVPPATPLTPSIPPITPSTPPITLATPLTTPPARPSISGNASRFGQLGNVGNLLGTTPP